MSFLDQEIERIRQSGALGRSPAYAKLLAYLSSTTEQGKTPKEVDIAIEVFGRRDFDAGTDSSVRVYLHNLRQKLESYYSGEGAGARQPQFLYIPKGEYRLEIGERVEEKQDVPAGRRSPAARAAPALVAAFMTALALGWLASSWFSAAGHLEPAAETAVWQPILQSERPLVVVLGDYYLFAEIDEDGVTRRLIRDFRIDGSEDLESGYGDAAAPERRFADIRLNYLPLGAAPALAEILEVIHSAGKSVVVIPGSHLDVQTVTSSDIVYIGYLSGLGMLSEFVFASSNFMLGGTYDELIDKRSGKVYLSEAGFLDGPATDYLDYGLVSTFAGPTGNRLLIMAGMRDEGLMQMASVLSSGDAIAGLMAELPASGKDFSMEALYRVRGMHRMNIASTLLFASTLDSDRIWTKGRAPDVATTATADKSGAATGY